MSLQRVVVHCYVPRRTTSLPNLPMCVTAECYRRCTQGACMVEDALASHFTTPERMSSREAVAAGALWGVAGFLMLQRV